MDGASQFNKHLVFQVFICISGPMETHFCPPACLGEILFLSDTGERSQVAQREKTRDGGKGERVFVLGTQTRDGSRDQRGYVLLSGETETTQP